MDYKTFVKQEFLKHKNSGLSAPQIMKQAGLAWHEYKLGHAGKAPKAKANKKVKAGSISGGALASSVPLSSMRSVSMSRPDPSFLVTNGAIRGAGFWSDLGDGFKSVFSTIAPVLPMLL
jgi:hypothetical protein